MDVGEQSERVKQLSKLLNQQQAIVYRHQNIRTHFDDGPMLKVAERTWEQIHPNIGASVEVKFHSLFSEFGTHEKLKKIDELKNIHRTSNPAWRPSGIPSEDQDTAARAEAKDMLTDFESKYLEVQKLTPTIHQTLKEKKEHLQKLESQIRAELKTITE